VTETAGRLGKSENVVYMLLHRGLKALRESLTFVSRYSLTG
jgi:DNA-directed RNA polymerase specialized sigma24 family protein